MRLCYLYADWWDQVEITHSITACLYHIPYSLLSNCLVKSFAGLFWKFYSPHASGWFTSCICLVFWPLIVLVYLSLISLPCIRPTFFFPLSVVRSSVFAVCVTRAHFLLLPPAGLESCIWVPFAKLDRKRPHTSYRLAAERWRNVWSGGSYTRILTVINKYSGEQ